MSSEKRPYFAWLEDYPNEGIVVFDARPKEAAYEAQILLRAQLGDPITIRAVTARDIKRLDCEELRIDLAAFAALEDNDEETPEK